MTNNKKNPSNLQLRKPLDWCILRQPFGVNYVDFYAKLGLNGHNGIDLKCYENKIYAVYDGQIKYSGKYSDGGIGIELVTADDYNGEYFKAVYYHLKEVNVKSKDYVIAGQPISVSDNSGQYTTGNHLHFGLKKCDKLGNTLNYRNGYHGAIDPTPYLADNFYKLPVHLRYGKPRNWYAEWLLRFKNVWVHRQLLKIARHPLSLTEEEVNAIIYGAWDFSIAINPAMYPIVAYLTKSEYKQGKRPPQGFSLSI